MKVKIKNLVDKLAKINIINPYTEKVLMVITLCCIFFLIVSQIGLRNKTTKTFFTDIDKYEGVDIHEVEGHLNKGAVILELVDIEPNKDIKILLNGLESYAFVSETLSINVRNNSLIEVDGTTIETPFKIKIVDASNNIATRCIGNEIEVNSNISILTRIFLK